MLDAVLANDDRFAFEFAVGVVGRAPGAGARDLGVQRDVERERSEQHDHASARPQDPALALMKGDAADLGLEHSEQRPGRLDVSPKLALAWGLLSREGAPVIAELGAGPGVETGELALE